MGRRLQRRGGTPGWGGSLGATLLVILLAVVAAGPSLAQSGTELTSSLRPLAKPATLGGAPATDTAAAPAVEAETAPIAATTQRPKPAPRVQPAIEEAPRDPSKGVVTNLPVPRYVSLKTNEGNARRGPGLSHRVDWVFTKAGLPLRITAEYENWRRIEDAEGLGGWVHYSLLSGVRSILVTADRVVLLTAPEARTAMVAEAEAGVIGKLIACQPDWCRVDLGGYRGWVEKTALWGVDAGEVFD